MDEYILNELRDQKTWWENEIDKLQKKLKDYGIELAKVNRLIEVFESRTKKS